jgi:serine/threonine protein kinase
VRLFAACSDPGFDIASVHEVSNPTITGAFKHRLGLLQTRKGNPHFHTDFRSESHSHDRQAIVSSVSALSRPFNDADYPDVMILPVWHGTKASALDSILNGSFATLSPADSTDIGYFGRGVYGTPDAEYAWRVYAKRCGVLLLCCFSFFSPYPVVGRDDMQKLMGKGNYLHHDAHVVPVVPNDPTNPDEVHYFPSEAGAAAACTYLEVVVFEQQALPRFIVELRPRSIPRSLAPVPCQFAKIFRGTAVDDNDFRQLASSMTRFVLLRESMQQGDNQRRQRKRCIRHEHVDENVQAMMKTGNEVAIGEVIGEGRFSKVYRARYLLHDVAVKTMKSATEEMKSSLKKEALIMLRANSPFVVRVYGILAEPFGIIMELVQQGSLHDLLQKRALTADEQFTMCEHVATGLKILHDLGILHCDLKGRNILVDDSLTPKIADFGISRARIPSGTLDGSTVVPAFGGTVEWMAPELFEGNSGLSTASDIFALGMVFLEIATRKNPWAEELNGQAPMFRVPGWILEGRRPNIPSDVHPLLSTLIQECWRQKPDERPSIYSIRSRLESRPPVLPPAPSRSPILSLGQVSVHDRSIVSIGSLVGGQPSEQNSDPLWKRLRRCYSAHRKSILACICALLLSGIIIAAVYGSQKQATSSPACGASSAKCDPNAVCNTNGQCVCNPGYFGNGLTCAVGYVGSCAQNRACHVAGTCSDISAGGLNGFACSCPSWLSGQGYSDSPCTCPLSDYPVPDFERGVCVTKRSSMTMGQVAGMVIGTPFVLLLASCFTVCCGGKNCTEACFVVWMIILGLSVGLSVGLTHRTWAPLPKVACGADSAALHLCDYNAACTGTKCVCNSDYAGDGTNCLFKPPPSASSSIISHFCTASIIIL